MGWLQLPNLLIAVGFSVSVAAPFEMQLSSSKKSSGRAKRYPAILPSTQQQQIRPEPISAPLTAAAVVVKQSQTYMSTVVLWLGLKALVLHKGAYVSWFKMWTAEVTGWLSPALQFGDQRAYDLCSICVFRYQGQARAMPDATVYSLLLQAYHADKSAARLLQALQELAGRLEVCHLQQHTSATSNAVISMVQRLVCDAGSRRQC